MARKSVAIIGGGYVGSELAKALEANLDVTLIEPREAFVHAPAMIRAVVAPDLLETALIPYDGLLSSGRIIADRAVAIDDKGVTLKSGERVETDFVIVATGSTNGVAFKPEGDTLETFRAAQGDLNARLKAAKSIIIVGAGAVGTELAGEIAHAMPEKEVTLVSSDATLFPTMHKKLGASLLAKLRVLGVDVVLGARATDLKDIRGPSAGPLTLSNGDVLNADLIVPAIGARPNTELLVALPGTQLAADGRIKVDTYLRPSSLGHVFAAGDVVDAGDAATIVAISRQAPWLAKTLKGLAQGADLSSLKAYSPWGSAPILVPLGPQRGASFLVIATMGDWITRIMKGRDLFIPKYRKLFGLR